MKPAILAPKTTTLMTLSKMMRSFGCSNTRCFDNKVVLFFECPDCRKSVQSLSKMADERSAIDTLKSDKLSTGFHIKFDQNVSNQ